jgi:hypothetical protein
MRTQPNPSHRPSPDEERNIGIIGTVTLIAVVLVILVGAYVFNMPDRRSASERLNSASRDLNQGVNQAANDLRDRTPTERLGDAIRNNETNPPPATNP